MIASSKMESPVAAGSKIIYLETAGVSLSKIQIRKGFLKKKERWLIDFYWRKSHWQASYAAQKCLKAGYNPTSMRNTITFLVKSRSNRKKTRLTIECDEVWSFVGNKENKQWIWLALDRDTREIVGVYIGSRDVKGAQALWDSLPPVYRQCAVSYTDFWAAYACIFPSKGHHAVGKESGQTNHVERLNNTFRQRISRLVQKTLSFSKKIENHIGAIWLFFHHYNVSIHASIT